jgi:hypothetical protein
MKNLRIYWGETLPIIVESDNLLALTATLTIGTIGGEVLITKEASFNQFEELKMEADVSVLADETKIEPGKYSYQIKIVYSNGDVQKFPDGANCSDCSLPTVTILPSLDQGAN